MLLAWGKFNMWIGKLTNGSASSFVAIHTPVEDSLQLTPTKGDKLEAKIEGGEAEAVKYKRNTYVVEFEIRYGIEDGKVSQKPFSDEDGVIDGEYAILIQPEDATVPGLKIDRCALSCETTFSSADGIKVKYTADVLKPATGDQVKLEVITVPTNVVAAASEIAVRSASK